MYDLILRGWEAGKFTPAQIDLFVRVRYITASEANEIKKTPQGES